MTIRQQAFSGVRWNALSKGISAIGSIVQLYILVRFIEPADFGLMAMVNVFLFFVLNFLDFGMNNGIVHKEKISREQLSTLYWFTLILGLGLAVVFWSAGSLVAWFYGEWRLVELIRVLSVVFIISSFGNQFKTLLLKELQFDALAIISIAGFFSGFISTVTLAIWGYGVWALVWGSIAKALIESLMAVGMGKKIFWPQWLFRVREIDFFIRFGLYQMGERILNFFNRQFDVILIGKLLGPEILGFYDVIKRFLLRPMELINPVITGVLFPIMARVQEAAEQLSTLYLKQLNYICALSFPLYLLLFFNAETVIQLLFGNPWMEYVNVFKIYLLVVLNYSAGNPVGTLILAKGRAALGFYWNLALFFMIPLTVYLGARWGLTGVVQALLLMQLLLIFPNYYFLVRPLIPVGLKSYFWKMLQPLFHALVATGPVTWLFQSIMTKGLLQLSIIAVLSGFLYLWIGWQFNRSFIQDLKAMGDL